MVPVLPKLIIKYEIYKKKKNLESGNTWLTCSNSLLLLNDFKLMCV